MTRVWVSDKLKGQNNIWEVSVSGLSHRRIFEIVDQLCPDPSGQLEFEIELPEAISARVSIARDSPGGLTTLTVLRELKERDRPELLFEDFHLLHSSRNNVMRLQDHGFGKVTDFQDGDSPEGYWFGALKTPPLRSEQKLPISFRGNDVHPNFDSQCVREFGRVWSEEALAQALLTIESLLLRKPQPFAPSPPDL